MYRTVWILEASIPLLMLTVASLLFYLLSRSGRFKVRVNLVAYIGAALAFISFTTGWSVIASHGDVSWGTDYALFLLFTYPFAVVTPLIAFGQAGMLLWVLGYANQHAASITPIYGYSLAWISTALMVASIFYPLGVPRSEARPDVYDRLLTITFRRSSGDWMATRNTAAVLYVLVSLVVGAFCIASNAPVAALAFLLVGFVFAWFFLERGLGSAKPHVGGPANEPGEVAANTAWISFVALSYIASIVAIETYTGAFGIGRSGEEKTQSLIKGIVALAIVIPLIVVAHRRAQAPLLPRDLTLASVAAFALFVVMASLILSPLGRAEVSSRELLALAGIALLGPALLHIQGKSKAGGPMGDDPNG